MRPDFTANPAPHPQGMVLAFTLIILVLMGLMGASILGGSRAELNISSNASLGRNAFATTDAAARIAALTGRIMLHPELGSPAEIISKDTDLPWRVDMAGLPDELMPAEDGADFQNLVKNRYLGAGGADGVDSDGQAYKPHLVFWHRFKNKDDKIEEKQVAYAVLSLDRQSPVGAGMSLGGGDAYDGGTGASLQITLVVSANGRAPTSRLTGTGAFEADGAENDEPHSVVTMIYRERL